MTVSVAGAKRVGRGQGESEKGKRKIKNLWEMNKRRFFDRRPSPLFPNPPPFFLSPDPLSMPSIQAKLLKGLCPIDVR